MRKPKKQKKPLNDLSRSLTPYDLNRTLISAPTGQTHDCIPAAIVTTPT
jgi:hypothetical protein